MEDRRHFDISLDLGEQGEEWSKSLILGDGNTTFEVKTDLQSFDTGNIFIEVESWGKPGGISVTKADWWIYNIVHVPHDADSTREQRAQDYREYNDQGLDPQDIPFFVVVNVEYLKQVIRRFPLVSGGDENKAMGHLVPLEALTNTGLPPLRRV